MAEHKKEQKHKQPQSTSESKTGTEKASSSFQKQIADKQQKIEELTKLAKQVQADFENFKKRTERDQQSYIELGKVLVLKRMLPVLDSFEKAMEQDKAIFGPLYNQLISALESLGLKKMECIGMKFDPHKHNCIAESCGHEKKGDIVEEVTKGYMLNDLIIRHANVRVSKGPSEESKPKEAV
ncbi:nucleotide exchange factor GrpE [Candidatus Woesearchaeota archaeon]|nr:nucleotide exchange factor GrpE [Candidatus Woesearchaeota archaeon]